MIDKTVYLPFTKECTDKVHNWMQTANDDIKMKFAINWKIAHTLFNVASTCYPYDKEDLQKVDWFKIYQSREMGRWSNNNKVIV